jgi:aspartate racemase
MTTIGRAIGIVGGVGPSAGTDLVNKVFRHTRAAKDQDHINLFLTSCPSLIPDRTGYLLNGGDDPAPGMQKCMEILAGCGATAIGIGCNTAHAPEILSRVRIPDGVELINMIEQTAMYVSRMGGGQANGKPVVGLLSTLGTLDCGVYDKYLTDLVKPDRKVAEEVHNAIYDSTYGIKATPAVSDKARGVVSDAVMHLKEKGCNAVILGCTELPLVFEGESDFNGVVLIDPTEILAIELIRATEPDKLLV